MQCNSNNDSKSMEILYAEMGAFCMVAFLS